MYIHRNRHLLNMQRNTHISTSHASSKHLLGMLTICMHASAITHIYFFEYYVFHRLAKYEITSSHIADKKRAQMLPGKKSCNVLCSNIPRLARQKLNGRRILAQPRRSHRSVCSTAPTTWRQTERSPQRKSAVPALYSILTESQAWL